MMAHEHARGARALGGETPPVPKGWGGVAEIIGAPAPKNCVAHSTRGQNPLPRLESGAIRREEDLGRRKVYTNSGGKKNIEEKKAQNREKRGRSASKKGRREPGGDPLEAETFWGCFPWQLSNMRKTGQPRRPTSRNGPNRRFYDKEALSLRTTHTPHTPKKKKKKKNPTNNNPKKTTTNKKKKKNPTNPNNNTPNTKKKTHPKTNPTPKTNTPHTPHKKKLLSFL